MSATTKDEMKNPGAPVGAVEQMSVESLEAYGIDRSLLAVWKKVTGPWLEPLQARAVKEFGVFSGGNLVVSGPGPAAKFLGEMVAAREARARRRVLFVVPDPDVAMETFRRFQGRYEPLGIKVAISSRDCGAADLGIAWAPVGIAVVTAEKLNPLFVGCPTLLYEIGAVVVDGLHLLADPQWGPEIELLLTEIRTATRRPRFIGLSSMNGKPNAIAEWLGAELVVDDQQDDRKGILSAGGFTHHGRSSSRVEKEPFRSVDSGGRDEMLLSATADLVRCDEQELVFVRDRRTAVDLARMLARQPIKTGRAETAGGALKALEDTHARRLLGETLETSVAFHHDGMTADERQLVERAFRAGEIRALFTTGTLASESRFSAENVIIDDLIGANGRPGERPRPRALTRAEYEARSACAVGAVVEGRAGRVILVAPSQIEARSLRELYLDGEPEELRPSLQNVLLDDLALKIIATSAATDRDQVAEFLFSSLTGRLVWSPAREQFMTALGGAIDRCIAGGLVLASDDGSLTISSVGRTAAAFSLGATTARALFSWADSWKGGPPAALEVIALICQTAAGRRIPFPSARSMEARIDPKSELLVRLDSLGLRERPVFAGYTCPRMLEHQAAEAVVMVLAMADRSEEVPTAAIERRFEVAAGFLERAGAAFGWICRGLAEICRACGFRPEWCLSLESLAESLHYGVRPDAFATARLRIPRLGRGHVARLRAAGLLDINALRAAGQAALTRALESESMAADLWERATDETTARVGGTADPITNQPCNDVTTEEHPAAEPAPRRGQPAGPNSPPAQQRTGPDIVIDTPGRQLTLWGVKIRLRPPKHLQPMLFWILVALARRAGQVVTVEEIRSTVRRLRGVKPAESDARKMRYGLLRALRIAVGERFAAEMLDTLIENVGGGLRLNATVRMIGHEEESL